MWALGSPRNYRVTAGYHENDAVAQAADDRQVRHVTLEDASRQVGVRRAEFVIVDDGVRRYDCKPHKHAKNLAGKRCMWIRLAAQEVNRK